MSVGCKNLVNTFPTCILATMWPKNQSIKHIHAYHLPRLPRDHSEEDEVGNTGNNKLSQPPAHAPSKPEVKGHRRAESQRVSASHSPTPWVHPKKQGEKRGVCLHLTNIKYTTTGKGEQDRQALNKSTHFCNLHKFHRNFTKVSLN